MTDLYSPSDFLNPRTMNLEQLLGEHFFEVPAYQRNYAWQGEEEVRQLWQDICAVSDRSWLPSGLPVDKRRPHFFGAIVVQQREDDPTTFEVMDGQQRLITFSILVSILNELSREIPDIEQRNNWEGTLSKLLSIYVSGQLKPRLKLGRSSGHFVSLFCSGRNHEERASYIEQLGDNRPPELVSMDSSYEQLRKGTFEFLESADSFQQGLIRLNRTVLGLSLFLMMSVKQPDAAYEVFEGLNARGRELSQADLIKNKLFSVAEPQGTLAQVQRNWEATYVSINGQSMVDMPLFLQLHHWAFHGVVKATGLYDAVATNTLKSIDALEYSLTVKESAERLQRTLDAGALFDDGAIRNIEAIRDVLSNRFALLLVVASTRQCTMDSEEYSEVLRLAHHFAFRRFVIGDASLSVYSSELAEAALEYQKAGDLQLLRSHLRAKSSDSAFIADFKEARSRTNKEGFYVCEMIERHLGSDAGMLPNRQSPSQHLEHIFPRNPKPGDWPNVDKDELERHVNRLGNLLVLEADINRSIRNYSYSFKKSNNKGRDYQNSGLQLPRSLNQYEEDGEWTFGSIERRQVDLADNYATKVWPL